MTSELVVDVQPKEVSIALLEGSIVLNIQGQGLELTGMTPTRARVSGAIKKLCFERA